MSARVVWMGCLVLGGLLGLPTHGAAPPDFHYRLWTPEEGLPTGSVRDVAQTPDGYLWIATLDGLVRFDGVRMRVLHVAETPRMTSNRCLTLLVDRTGALWVGTEDGGVLRVRASEVHAFGLQDGLPSLFIGVMEEDSEGKIWVETDAGTACFDGNRWSRVTPSMLRRSSPGPDVALFIEDGRAVEYASHLLPARPHPPLWVDRGRRIWFETGQGTALRLRRGSVERVQWPLVAPDKRLAQEWARIVEGGNGRLWVLDGGHLYLREGGAWRSFPTPVPTPILPRPRFLFEDREGTLWMGGDGGLVQASPTAVRALVPPGPRLEAIVYTLAPDPSGRIWVGTQGSPLVWERGTFTRVHGQPWWPLDWATAIEPDRHGTILAGGPEGAFRIWPGRRFERLRGGGIAEYRDFLRDRSGTLWIASEEGLLRSTDRGFEPVTGLPSKDVRVLLEAKDGAVWVGSYGGLTRISGKELESWTVEDGLSSNRIRALHEDGSGHLWIGTYDGGLNRFAGGKFVSIGKRDGLFDHGAFAILEDGDGRFWVSSNRGVYTVSMSDLTAFASGAVPRIFCRFWTSADGMPSSECNGGRQPAGFRAADGTLWFPTQRGIAVLDPRAVGVNTKPPLVVIEEISTDRRSIPAGPSIELAPGERRLEVRYTANTFVHPEGARFRHRLVPFEEDWVEAGDRRFAPYTAVPPGRYRLQVVAANSDGVWSPHGASLAIRVRPFWWQTLWFRCGATVLVLGFLATGYRRRVSRLKRRRAEQDAFARLLLQSQEAERKRIAGELHDGIGQTLVVIRNRALLGMRDSTDAGRQIAEISTAAAEGIEEVRKVAYGLRPYQLDRLGLRRALAALVEQLASASGIPIDAEIGEVDGAFVKDAEINVYRIVQEGLNNLAKHAHAQRARVAVSVRAQEIEIVIEDDGAGFDAAAMAGGRGGLGLSGIAERARILGGRSAIRSSPGQGTTVTVSLPRGAATP